ncbi:Bifunctional inhibitor/plant lipid transfer protein/seed storage helical domain containing protein [Melia azedarach]|uniref:Bifunctional inhibitor/plant lipid transfer protein/seed storage helical domain containing protein n=1 Tax=Melia azedarach TaxID=155640 RepID=A0ACC1YGJ9_MELAZ|nr:Bifunctional inhibitor/plant lipid transfer protein/seed storage helical domain containing protein [Melia azedarach]
MIILLLLLTTSSQPSPPPPPPSGCATELVAFSPCLPYVSLPPNNLTDTVMPECCNVVSSAFQSGDGDCLCYLLRQPLIFGFPLNETRVLSLSSVCNANGSVELICSSGSPALPPLRSPTGSEISKPSNSGPSMSMPPRSTSNSPPTLSWSAVNGARSPKGPRSAVQPATGSSSATQIFNSNWLLPGILLFLLVTTHMWGY